ncbi:MAG: hypothetical protein M9949_10755 [Candidatus Kapabacteria bacterium]|nr:hypothetical protein [Candidatus Kapabacteria bacterium]
MQIKTLQAKPESDLTEDERNQLQMLEEKAKQTADAIGKIVPEARENFRRITDESGNLVKVYDINIDKQKNLLRSEKKHTNSNNLMTKQHIHKA